MADRATEGAHDPDRAEPALTDAAATGRRRNSDVQSQRGGAWPGA